VEALLQGEYRGERIGDLVPTVLYNGQPPVLLLTATLELFQLPFDVASDGSVNGRVMPDELPFTFGVDGQLRIGSQLQPLPTTEFRLHHGELFVAPEALARLLPVRLTVEPRLQRLRIAATGPLALDMARQREAARAQLAARSRPNDLPLAVFPYQANGRPMGDLQLNTSHSGGAQSPSGLASSVNYSLVLSHEMFGLSTQWFASGSDSEPLSDLRLRAGRESPLGGALGLGGLTSFWAGDVQAPSLPLAGAAGSVRGVVASAYPLDQPERFDETVIEGDAPPGWDVELMRGSQLISFQVAGPDGRYRFEAVDLQFGENLFEVSLYGPQGQRRREQRSLRVGGGMVQPGRMYWRAFAGEPGQRLLGSLLSRPYSAVKDADISAGVQGELGLMPLLTATAFATRLPEGLRVDSIQRHPLGTGLRASMPWVYL
jgi:hypothetical protein